MTVGICTRDKECKAISHYSNCASMPSTKYFTLKDEERRAVRRVLRLANDYLFRKSRLYPNLAKHVESHLADYRATASEIQDVIGQVLIRLKDS